MSVKLINTQDQLRTITIRDVRRSVKHVAFQPRGSLFTAACTDGVVVVFDVSSEEPRLVTRIDHVLPRVEPEDEVTCKVAWHPDGAVLAVPNAHKRDIVVISRDSWEVVKHFQGGHSADITDFAWSPNGAYLASCARDGTVLLWETRKQTVLARYEHRNVVYVSWHPLQNELSFATNQGTIATHPEFVPSEYPPPFGRLQSFSESGSSVPLEPNGRRDRDANDDDDEERDAQSDSWIEDDDQAGYINGFSRKRAADGANGYVEPAAKTLRLSCKPHAAFQPGSTPWRNGRRYLVLNLIGFVWSVDQGAHNTVTIDFFDQERFRSTHFTDHFKFDKACLNDVASFFTADPIDDDKGSRVWYRPHESWASHADWATDLPLHERAVAIGLSTSYAVVCTNKYVRVYTCQGMPVRIYRPKSSGIVACATWCDYVMVVGNGPVLANGSASLTYSVDDVKRDETMQDSDMLPLPIDAADAEPSLQSVFFSEDGGDPLIYDSDGVLSVLLHWRRRGDAKWVPLLDTKSLARRVGKQESYWPVAVMDDKFHCIILKGGERYPYFPRPVLSEFQFMVPIGEQRHRDAVGDGEQTTAAAATVATSENALEAKYVCELVLYDLREDAFANKTWDSESRAQHARREATLEKTLLQLIQLACRDDREQRSLDLVGMLKRPNSMEAASRIALHHGKTTLGEKINELRYERMQR